RQKVGVAPPAPTALGGEDAVAAADEVGEDAAVPVPHDRPLGDGHDEVGTGRPVTLLARAVGPGGGPAVGVVPEGDQRGDVAVGTEPDVAALAAVAAVRPAPVDVRFPPEGDRAG